MYAEQPMANAVESPPPEAARLKPGQILDPLEHFLCGLVSERKKQNVIGADPL